jgi:hypothetical protein
MDPTLAPGYVPPNNGKERLIKGHHWAEIKKTNSRNGTDNSEVDGDGDTSSTSSPPSPPIQPTVARRRTANSGKTSLPRHPRMSSWRAGRLAISDGEGIGGPADLEEVPIGVKRQALRLEDYAFPDHRLHTVMDGNSL